MSNKPHELVGRPAACMVNVGHGNFLVSNRVVAILESGSLPMKRLREKAAEQNLLVDATAGRKMRSLIVTDSKHVILSALAPQTMQERLQEGRGWLDRAQLEMREGEFIS
jgi:extracellular matrix regulatory protein A